MKKHYVFVPVPDCYVFEQARAWLDKCCARLRAPESYHITLGTITQANAGELNARIGGLAPTPFPGDFSDLTFLRQHRTTGRSDACSAVFAINSPLLWEFRESIADLFAPGNEHRSPHVTIGTGLGASVRPAKPFHAGTLFMDSVQLVQDSNLVHTWKLQ